MFMSQEKLQTMSMQNFWRVKEVHYGIVQVVNWVILGCHMMCHGQSCLHPLLKGDRKMMYDETTVNF